MQTLALTDVKTHLSALVDEVADTQGRVTITRHGRPAAVIVSVEELQELEETLAWLAVPGAQESIAETKADIAAGRTMSTAEMLDHLHD